MVVLCQISGSLASPCTSTTYKTFSTDPSRTLGSIKALITAQGEEIDLIVVDGKVTFSIDIVRGMTRSMLDKTIVIDCDLPQTQALFRQLGVGHICSKSNLRFKMMEVLGLASPEPPYIKATVKRPLWAIDFSKTAGDDDVQIQPGEYELVRIPNPYRHDAFCLVLKGTLIGMVEAAWIERIKKPGHPSPWVILEENGQLVPHFSAV
jgi:hypothetical protein